MFTGLVEACGTVAGVVPEGDGVRLEVTVSAELAREGAVLGESVSISGCCLTVVDQKDGRWEFQAGAETLAKTHLGRLKIGHRVNLERALPANGRLGGHFVQGHVDGVGELLRKEPHGEWVDLWFAVPARLTRYMVAKGSIALDGVSLTLVNVGEDRVSVALIPHTLAVTSLGTMQVGDPVNVEVDLLAKYVEKLVTGSEKVNVER
jgi:riboflavin synthase